MSQTSKVPDVRTRLRPDFQNFLADAALKGIHRMEDEIRSAASLYQRREEDLAAVRHDSKRLRNRVDVLTFLTIFMCVCLVVQAVGR